MSGSWKRTLSGFVSAVFGVVVRLLIRGAAEGLLFAAVVRVLARAAVAFDGFTGVASSRTHSLGVLSFRRPWKAGCRIFPSGVHSVNSTSPTRCGSLK